MNTTINNMKNLNTRSTAAALKYREALAKAAAQKRYVQAELEARLAESDRTILGQEILIFILTLALFFTNYK